MCGRYGAQASMTGARPFSRACMCQWFLDPIVLGTAGFPFVGLPFVFLCSERSKDEMLRSHDLPSQGFKVWKGGFQLISAPPPPSSAFSSSANTTQPGPRGLPCGACAAGTSSTRILPLPSDLYPAVFSGVSTTWDRQWSLFSGLCLSVGHLLSSLRSLSWQSAKAPQPEPHSSQKPPRAAFRPS